MVPNFPEVRPRFQENEVSFHERRFLLDAGFQNNRAGFWPNFPEGKDWIGRNF